MKSKISSLQRLRMVDGSLYGAIHLSDGALICQPYNTFVNDIVNSETPDLLRHFVLTVGIVSNHGNWFTSDDHNKELKVLAQSYDWLLFLTDAGLARFITDLLLQPAAEYQQVREAFVRSYTGVKRTNVFTKTQITLSADRALQTYFAANAHDIEGWFNVIAPFDTTIDHLKQHLQQLAAKNWREILK